MDILVPTDWIPATYFAAPPSAIARRWWRVIGLSPFAPGARIAMFMHSFGQSGAQMSVQIRSVPVSGGGSRLQARLYFSSAPVPQGP